MMNSLLVLSAKKYLRVSAVLALPCLALPVYAQDQAAQETERQQRIQELRQLQREERAERRQVIQAQLDTLTEEQKAALQERRQMQRRARNERMARGPQRRSNRCQCDELGADATDS